MKKVRAFQLMKDNESWVKVWKQKDEERCFWTNGKVLFFDAEFLHWPVGYYVFRDKTLMPISKSDFPVNVKNIIPKTKGYHKATLPYLQDGNYLNIDYSLNGGPDLVQLKAPKTVLYIDLRYFEYTSRWFVSNWTVWKVKDTTSPVLIYYEKELKGIAMPYKYEV